MGSGSRTGELVGQKLGKYELLSLIAVGGTAEIYLARVSGASGFEKYLVVKCLLDHLADDPDFVRMFLDEARVGAQLEHSNIVQTLELGQHDGRYFLVMEYLAGMSVAQMARKTQERAVNGGFIEPNLVLGMVAQTCNGLFYAHNKKTQGVPLNLVHRDISPQNLVISYEGILKIVDFGIAKSDIRDSQTKTGTIKGKFAYMSPEQCLAKDVDHRTDIFALGTLCHELLTGRRLFKRQSTYDTYQAIISGNVPLPSSINPRLNADVDRMVMKALAYKREERYQHAQEFSDAILTLMHKRAGSGSPTDIARFFDDHFQDDLKAHATQMREFITGRTPEVPDSTWDSELEEVDDGAPKRQARPDGSANRAATAPIATRPSPRAATAPAAPRRAPAPAAPRRAPAPAILPSILPAAPDMNIDAGDDDEATRVEFNPADKVAAFHSSETGETRVAMPQNSPAPTGQGRAPGGPPRQPPGPPPPGPPPPGQPPRKTRQPGMSAAAQQSSDNRPTAHFPAQGAPAQVAPEAKKTSLFQAQRPPLAAAAPAMPQGPPFPVAAAANPTPLPSAMPLHAAVGLPPVPSSVPIDLSGPGSAAVGLPSTMPGMLGMPPAQFTAAVPKLPAPSVTSLSSGETPPWKHAIVFLGFLAMGYSLVAVLKSVL
ncbi:MAG: serine/threonine protein kinase [Kofleriaceae bacterium]|nr:serine/threonine protein kinase [Kofleriaceae bacterium]